MSRAALRTAALAVLVLLPAPAIADPGSEGCSVRLHAETVLVAGDAGDNAIAIAVGEAGTQVVCDGFGETVADVAEIVVEAGAGDDRLKLVTGPRADLIEIGPGGSAEIQVTDVATRRPVATISASGLEAVSAAGGDGDDEFRSVGLPGITLELSGQAGDDEWKYVAARRFAVFLEQSLGEGLEWAVFDGGAGEDRLDLLTAAGRQLVTIRGVPDRDLPDPEIRVTDVERDLLVADLFVQQTEVVAVATGNGDDRVEITRDAALAGGLSRVSVDLGNGDDLLEAAGPIDLRAHPGRGFDTARVTRDLLPLVTTFERVEVLGDAP